MSNAPHVLPHLGTDQAWDWPREVEASWQEVWITDLGATSTRRQTRLAIGVRSPGTCAIDIWIADVSQLRKGYGTVMMKDAIDRCFRVHSAHTILVDPLAENDGAISIHQHLGVDVIGKRTFDADECTVLRLCRPDSGCD